MYAINKYLSSNIIKHKPRKFEITGQNQILELYCYPSLRYYSNNVDRVKFLTANVQEDIVKMGEELKMIRSEIDKKKQKYKYLSSNIIKHKPRKFEITGQNQILEFIFI
jgi:hypothetical protein